MSPSLYFAICVNINASRRQEVQMEKRYLIAGFKCTLALACAIYGNTAFAFPGGADSGPCTGCHLNASPLLDSPTLAVALDPFDKIVVDTIYNLTVVVQNPSPIAGFNLDLGGGSLIPGLLSEIRFDGSISHSAPSTTGIWTFGWQTPSDPGNVFYTLWGLEANNNGTSSGDRASLSPVTGSLSVFPHPTAVPAPSVIVLFSTGLLGLAGYRWHQRRREAGQKTV